MSSALILAGARTPFAAWSRGSTGRAEPGGALKAFDPFDLGAAALTGALARARLSAGDLGLIVFGNMYQVGAHGCYGARYVGHRAGAPAAVAGVTVNLACGTGLLALKAAAEAIVSKEARTAAAVGADSPSLLRRDVFAPSFTDISCGKPIARTAEERAAERGMTREQIDAWARRSHARARAAYAALAEEIVPVAGVLADDLVLGADLPDPFAAARAMFDDGPKLVTGANTHGVADGGAALILSSAAAASGRALGRVVSFGLVGTAPERMAYAAIPAARQALERARWRVGDVDLWELNETFAAQALIDSAELGLDPERVNVRGGAIALGHPFGATGLRQVLSLLLELRRRGRRRGLAAIGVGGGLGIAACVEAL